MIWGGYERSGPCHVFVNGSKQNEVASVFVLWNNGPGLIWQAARNEFGCMFVRRGRIATKARFGWHVRLEPIPVVEVKP